MSEQTLVMKFGSVSLGNPEAAAQVIEIIKQQRPNWPRLIVVTSALTGVTSRLFKSANQAAMGDIQT